MLTHFGVYLYKERLKAGTIKSYLVHISHTQIALDLGNPYIEGMSWLEYIICKVKRLTNGPTHSRLPITLHLLAPGKWRGPTATPLCLGKWHSAPQKL